MKRALSIILICLTVILLVACSNCADNNDTAINPAETHVETKPQEIHIGDFTVKYQGAIKYNPYSDSASKPTVMIYFDFKNNSDKAVIPSECIFISATQGNTKLEEYAYPKEFTAKEQDNLHLECKPNENVVCCYSLSFDENNEDISYQIKNAQDKTALSGTIKINELSLVKQNLNPDTLTQ